MIFAWLAFGMFYIWGVCQTWETTKGSNNFPGTEAGLCAFFSYCLLMVVGTILLIVACCCTFAGGYLAGSIALAFVFMFGTGWVLWKLGDADYEKKRQARINQKPEAPAGPIEL